ncbi:MAG: D-Ala-D-Ala carboxypeptidase family metallohydrolase [Pseudomonadota bacterium]
MRFTSTIEAQRRLQAGWRWPHFSVPELACRCGGRFCDGAYWHDPAFLDGLSQMRTTLGRAMVITSGHRCRLWNAAVGGAPLSQHKKIAADIWLGNHPDRQAVLDAARKAGFTGLGLAQTFLHLDRRARPAIWTYEGSSHLWKR